MNCLKCVQNKPAQKHRGPLQLFFASGVLDFVAMDVLGPLLEKSSRIHIMLEMKNCYSRLTTAVQTSLTTAAHILSRFMEHWTIWYGIPSYMLKENRTKFTSELFESLCTLNALVGKIGIRFWNQYLISVRALTGNCTISQTWHRTWAVMNVVRDESNTKNACKLL